MNKNIVLSVHQLVDFILRNGDIDTRIFNRSSMMEGTLLHGLYQSKQGDNYISEYSMKTNVELDGFFITLEGRADGIIKNGENDYIIDEIKTTIADLEEFKNNNFEWHLGQAKCYAYMFAKEHHLDKIGIRLTYIKQGEKQDKLFENLEFYFAELDQFLHNLLENYLDFYNIVYRNGVIRDETILKLNFPFDKYRKGQRELAKYAFGIAKNGGVLFAEAPTGIGKTISTLYPYIKNLPSDQDSKIFYLTAKNSGRDSAFDTISLLKNNGLILNNIVITAKEKICFCKDKSCNPEECPFAKNYYNKIQSIIRYALLNYNTFDFDTITSLAKENEVCPFELELDLSLFNDIIICDYNYLFDPTSYLKRFFDEDSSHHLVLVDEAHNLVQRSRDMYSASICELGFLKAKKSCRHCDNKDIKKIISKMSKLFKETRENFESGNTIVEDFNVQQYRTFNYFVNKFQEINKDFSKLITKELLNFYLDVNRFLKMSELISERYLCYLSKTDDDIIFHISCLDASRFIKKCINKVKATTFFSATLTPTDYFVDSLGGDKQINPILKLASPFPKQNLGILVAPKISIKYKNREKTYGEVADYIKTFIRNKVGNYLVYLPSYEYLANIKQYFENFLDADVCYQTIEMSEQEKIDFLNHFSYSPNKTALGFAIMGGSFSEGIDLVSDRLIGVVIIGIGLSKINFENDQISQYYSDSGYDGYKYAYLYPGMNKVYQAVGRVIRSENDKGMALLIDERYMTKDYQELYRTEWKNYEVVLNINEIDEATKKFYKN
ncbi:MAG: ATP-dependent DNA helicase [Bacilli bacterium]|nr:ATP-dependent DNA helicase [Bacilli bacterium]